jgi:hypothetical protein
MPGEVHDSAAPPRPSVFLSYASEDRAAARALRDTLTAAGLDVWLDEDELGGGEAWDTKIRNQIRTCTYFMPLISATTETRREGYFRREWRFAVERTLDLADDVMFLVPVVIDDTRDHGARVPEKFFSVQWLRAPGGAATAGLRELAGKLATGEAIAAHPPARSPAPVPERKSRSSEKPVPPFPDFPPFPEVGHRLRFIYNLVLWGGRMLHVFWLHLPRFVRVIAAIVIVFNLISWAFRETNRPAGAKPEKQFEPADIAKEISAASQNGDGRQATESIKALVGGVAEALQTGRPIAVVNFGGTGDDAATYADQVFTETFKLLQEAGADQVGLSPIPLEADDDDDDALARGTRLKSKFVLTGFASHPTPGGPLLFTAKLYEVKQRTVIWSESFDAAQINAPIAGQRVAAAVRLRALPAAQP